MVASPMGAAAARQGEVAEARDSFTGYFGRKLHQTCSYTCNDLNTCMTNTCSYFNSTHIYVLVNVGSCKPGSVSWFCCRQGAPICSLDTSSCSGTIAGNTCNTVTTVGYYVQIGVSSFSAQPASAPAAQPTATPAAQPSPAAAAQPASSQPAPAPSSPSPSQPATPKPPSSPSSPAPSEPATPKPASSSSSAAAAQSAPSQPAAASPSSSASQPPAAQPSASSASASAPIPAAAQPAASPASSPAPVPPSSEPSSPTASSSPTVSPSSQPSPSPAASPASLAPSSQPSPSPASSSAAVPPSSQPPASPAPAPSASAPIIFTWQPIQKLLGSETKWGGYFTIPPPPSSPAATSYTTTSAAPTPILGCAGCAKNDPRRGYDVGGITLQVRAVNSTHIMASCALSILNNPNVTVVVDQGHFYASFAPVPNFNPGQFPTSTITGLPGAESTTVTMTQRVGGTRPSSNPLIYLACHFTARAC
ncbi:hypothetical protein HYH03_015224 [Edaphochlamys debaryana]|uniref:Uncharacterized protein n=1 Tax=Edaphochlamys debaryana TaxID=47281 RepID=A0A836BR73_9CHLO|nr:hypothetical protein HYH03_015224 [Edaphochlamys debaryana]|eukprot:KAG2486131.1 hypothetical protein HYH03_015224 [Edaphochlamys debaryana]